MTHVSVSTGAEASGRFRVGGLTNRGLLGLVSAGFILPDILIGPRLRPFAGAVVVAAAVAALAVILSDPSRARDGVLGRPVRAGRLTICLALAIGLLILGGETHLFYANTDWLTRDAVLADLIRAGSSLPTYQIGSDRYLMRAPLGMYLAPALVGRGLGLHAAHVALLLQNALLLGGILYLLSEWRRSWRILAVVLLFSGPCVIWRALVVIATHHPELAFSNIAPLDRWNPYFEYSAPITQFFWVPNHALPGWWTGVLLLLLEAGEIDVATVGVSVALLMFWSPLAILPAIPITAFVALRNPRLHLTRARLWVGGAVASCFLPIAIYLTLASGTIAHDILLLRPDYPAWYFAFILIQLPPVGFVMVQRRRLRPELREAFWISAALLLLLPLVKFGAGNDLVMRASIPALLIVSVCFAEVLFQSRGLAAGIGWALAALGVVSPAAEVWRALDGGAFPISRCTLMEASRQVGVVGAPPNYVLEVKRVPAWLADVRDPPQATGIRDCWPGRDRRYQ